MAGERQGSSPLARGALFQQTGQLVALGLIPARAGSTTLSQASTICPGAHPRSRGEHISSNPPFKSSGGSSPLARGARKPRRSA